MRSFLDIYDLRNGRARTLLSLDGRVEAPNWAPSGDHLFVNSEGRLFRVALDAPALQPVPVEGLSRLNNDHGISPDGCTMAVTQSQGRGTAVIFTLPAAGGQARQITALAPSWWHGWSPDGCSLVYTCVRDERFGIATCPVDGGEETVLIASDHHYDGPEFTPDGQWIWFNSDRSGTMQLWRMRKDGAASEQMTHDARVNWFPHPGPDGRHVLFLSYASGVEGHPPDLEVQLRLLDLDTGDIRVLVDIVGGQGTINVPCWAPDGLRFAYIHYALD